MMYIDACVSPPVVVSCLTLFTRYISKQQDSRSSLSTAMANTAPKIAAEERQELPSEVDRKAEAVANQIRRSKHFIAFTGAGISTSAGMSLAPSFGWELRI